jgi:O-antigen/teichoic acid export membrane protein
MSEVVRIRKNSIFSFFSISSRLIANVVLFLIIARFYGPTLYGQFVFAQSLSLVFILIADFGIDVLFVNEVARDRKNAVKLFSQYFSLKILFCFIALAGMDIFFFVSNSDFQGRLLILVFSAYMMLTAISNFLYSLFKGFEKLEYEMKVSITTNVVLLIVTIVLLVIRASVLSIAIAFVSTRILGFVLAVRYSFVVLPDISYKLVFSGLNTIKNKVIIFGLHLVFNYLVFQLDTILLAIWKGDYEVGIYQSAFKLILIPLLIPEILINVLTPVLSRLNVENKKQWGYVGNAMSKFLYITIIPISIILFVYSDQIIHIIYGSKNYVNAIPILRIFALVIFIRFNFETFALMLTTSNKQNVRMYIVIVAALLNFVLNYFAIPHYGAVGAAVVALITNFFVATLYWITTVPFFYQWFFNPKIGVVFAVTLVGIIILWQFKYFTVFVMAPLILFGFIIIGYYYFLNIDERRILIPDRFRLFTLLH